MLYWLDSWLLRHMYRVMNKPPVQISLWNGLVIKPESHREPIAHIRIHNRGSFYRLFLNPDLYFGEGYSRGDIDIDGSLVRGLEVCYNGMVKGPRSSLAKMITYWQARPRRNTPDGSKRHIHHHYDIGNDFYRLWLDKHAMQYTCAYYPSRDTTLEDAQIAKMDHVARKLQLKPGDTVVEAGCGWGALGLHFARHYGVSVRAYNISHQQILYAREQAKLHGVEDKIEYVEDDYRNITGSYDVFVSVGMLEHVGTQNYNELGDVIARCLREDGRGLIHSIGRNRAARMNAWIERNIFPGAYPPTLREAMDIFEPNNFSVLDVENLRLHYAQTLTHWLERYDEQADTVLNMFDEQFVRAWRLYLAGSIAAFTSGTLQLFQITFAPGESNNIPWTREHIYRDEPVDEPHSEVVWKRAMS
ncbi:MAG: cyclopropane-fatty-acyl-phospholipid synthase family protein [Granulosicoccaceae bacterium]